MKKFEINTYKWTDNGYAPKAWGELSLKDGLLAVKMTCMEKEPLATVSYGPDAPVYKDSCMEFFFEVNSCGKYINLEMNSVGGYPCAIRKDRNDRTYITPFAEGGEPKAAVNDESWSVEAVLSVQKILSYFGENELLTLRGNFYKCGDETEYPHFGMYNEVLSDTPNFHMIQFFADIDIEELK